MPDQSLSIHVPPSTPETTSTPRSLVELFVTFTLLALQGFGGVLAVAHRTLVENKRWMTRQEFVELLAVSQLLPGANIVNLALMIGDRYFGWRGAAVALAGMALVPLIILLSLVAAYNHWAHLPAVAGAMRGMGAVAAGLTMGMGFKLMGELRSNPMGPLACIALGIITFVLIAVLRAPLLWVLLPLGLLGWLYARWCILRATRKEDAT